MQGSRITGAGLTRYGYQVIFSRRKKLSSSSIATAMQYRAMQHFSSQKPVAASCLVSGLQGPWIVQLSASVIRVAPLQAQLAHISVLGRMADGRHSKECPALAYGRRRPSETMPYGKDW